MLNNQALGLKVGLEIHRQLNTRRKLFCDCPTEAREAGEKIIFERYLREAQSELGELDQAAVFEFKKRRKIVYRSDVASACPVEMDEEPPHMIDMESNEIALTAALLMDATPVDEIHVMRKIVIDGSNTAGFQRTCIVALGGRVIVDGHEIPIQTITLEEDAARLLMSSRRHVEYDLSRLGIPLIEVATAPVIASPEEAVKAAKAIGDILRATGRVKRGLGTVRQDLNISIKGGALIEVKGVQELELIGEVIENEVKRQLHLIEISNKLKSRISPEMLAQFKPVDVTKIFESTQSKIIRKAVEGGGCVKALLLPGFSGLLSMGSQGFRLGSELAGYAKAWAEVDGIFHTDEMPAYGITADEVDALRNFMGGGADDAVVFVADVEKDAVECLRAVYERALEAFKGVPSETRAAKPDGTTVYLRPRPGAARMYPETDIPPVPIGNDYIEDLRKRLPETLEEQAQKLVTKYGLSRQLSQGLIDREQLGLFHEIVEKTGVSPTVVAATLTETLTSLMREGVNLDRLNDISIFEVFKALNEGLFSKELLRDVLQRVAENPETGVRDVLASMGLTGLDMNQVRDYVIQLVEENKHSLGDEKIEKRLMADLMRRYRGRVDGGLLHSILAEAIREKRLDTRGRSTL